MLCCVSRSALAGADQGPPYDHCSLKEQPVHSEKVTRVEQSPEPDVPPILLPCAICARTFMPQSLEKHSKICERSTIKKRKPFDSAKQRIQGTELAEFLPRQEKKRHSSNDRSSKPQTTWKQTHDDFLRAIRAARNEITDPTMQKPCGTTITANAPTRANEQGTCPTCNRHFGVKAYDRHVAWCKERITRVPISPATNVAKERLEARMKYRAPAVRNRRPTTREKYLPGSAITLSAGSKTSPTLVPTKAKECASAPSCSKSNDSPVKQKPAIVRRTGHTKESSSPTLPLKSRPMDRVNRPPEDYTGPATFRPVPAFKRTSYLPVPPLKHKKESLEEECGGSIPSPIQCKKPYRKPKGTVKRNKVAGQIVEQDERHQVLHSARSLKTNIVSARSQGNPKLNDVSINEEILGVMVKPCNIYKENQLTTWRQISEEKNCIVGNDGVSAEESSPSIELPDLKGHIEDLSVYEKHLESVEFALSEEVPKEETGKLSSRSGSIHWPIPIESPTLNRTYSFRDSVMTDKDDDVQIIQSTRSKKWKPVRHSPRVEFCFGDPEKMSNVAHLPLIGSGLSVEMNARNGPKNSSKKLKEETAKIGSSKCSTIKDEGIAMNEDQLREEDFSFETSDRRELPSEDFKSPRNRILEKKRLRTTTNANFSSQNNYGEDTPSYSNLSTVHSLGNSQENDIYIDALNIDESVRKGRSLLDFDNSQTVHTNENVDLIEENVILSKETSRFPISSEQHAYLDEFDNFCEPVELKGNDEIIDNDINDTNQDVNQLTSRSDRLSSKVNETRYTNNLKKEDNECNADIKDSVRSSHNELEYPTENNCTDSDGAFYNTETNWIEEESDPFLTEESVLQPTRSSTPFLNVEKRLSPNCDDYSNIEIELCPNIENSEWKTEIDTERGSEVMYRIESRGSDRSSSRYSARNKVDKANSEDNSVQFRNCSGSRHSERNQNVDSFSGISSPVTKKDRRCSSRRKEGSLSRIASPTVQEEEQVKLPKIHRKEMASQINICNCSLAASSNFNCEKGIGGACVNSVENVSYSGTKSCNIFVNESVQEDAEESLVAQTRISFEETNFNRNLNESSTNQFDDNVEKDHHDGKDNVDLNDSSNIFEKSTVEANVKSEDVQEIYKNYSTKDFDCDSDNSIEHRVQDAVNRLKSTSVKNGKVKQDLQNMRSIVLSESCVKLSQRVRRVDNTTMCRSTALESRRSKTLEIENRIREKTAVLNKSSDSLSSVDAVDVKEVESVEVETIEEIGTKNRSIRFKILPVIKGAAVVVKEQHCDEKEKINTQTYWEKASKASKNRLINLDPPYQGASRFLKRNPKVRVLPPVPSSSSLISQSGKDYDPFLLAEQQMNDLLSDTSEQSVPDSPSIEQNRDSSFPLSHSSAFVKYPCQPSLAGPAKRSSLIAPPSEFDDLTSDFSSDSTETNSLSREVFLKDLNDSKEYKDSILKSDLEKKSPVRELGRRVIIDKSKALGGEMIDDATRGSKSFVGSSERARKILDKVSPTVIRPAVNRSLSVRASSAPKTTPDSKISNSSHDRRPSSKNNNHQRLNNSLNSRNNNYMNLSSSNLSLSSIMSSEADIKRSNSVFDELMTSFEDENGSFPSLKSLLKDDSLSASSPVHGRQRNGQISDDELSSPESYKRQDHSKMSADSAYSSLNRKYSHHGRSTNDVAGRFEEDLPRNNRREGDGVVMTPKCKMSKYCYECGSKFLETAKFCCECGEKRLVL